MIRSQTSTATSFRSDRFAEGADVLGRLAQRRGVDPRHGDGAFLTEKLSRDGGALGGGSRDPDPPREGREPGVGRLHFVAQPSEAARPGLAHAFQLGADLSPAHGRETDADAFLGHSGPLEMMSDFGAAHRPLEKCIIS